MVSCLDLLLSCAARWVGSSPRRSAPSRSSNPLSAPGHVVHEQGMHRRDGTGRRPRCPIHEPTHATRTEWSSVRPRRVYTQPPCCMKPHERKDLPSKSELRPDCDEEHAILGSLGQREISILVPLSTRDIRGIMNGTPPPMRFLRLVRVAAPAHQTPFFFAPSHAAKTQIPPACANEAPGAKAHASPDRGGLEASNEPL